MAKDNRQSDLQISDNDTAVDMLHKMYVAKYVKIHSDGSLIFEYPADGSINIERFVNFVSRFNALHPYIVQVLKDERFNKVKISEVLANCNDECLPIYTDINDDKFAKDPVKHTVMLSAKVLYIARVCPYIAEEIKCKDVTKALLYRGITLSEVISNADTDSKGRVFVIDPAKDRAAAAISEAYKAYIHAGRVSRAKAARAAQLADTPPADKDANNQLSKIRYNKTNLFTASKDTFTASFYSLMPPFNMVQGQITMALPFIIDDKKEVTLSAIFSYDRDYLIKSGIVKRDSKGNVITDTNGAPEADTSFDPGYDYFVAMACDNLLAQGNSIVTLAKILKEMGIAYSQKEADKLLYSLRKGKATNAIVHNKEVLLAWNKLDKTQADKYKEIDGQLVPIRIINERFIVNGNIADTQIEIMAFSPFYQVASPITQIATWDKRILTLYTGRRVKKYWRVMHYLMDSISYLRSGRRNTNRFLLSTIYDYVGDTNKHQKDATDKIVYQLLDEVFKPLDYVSSYNKIANRAFDVTYHQERKPAIDSKSKNQK